MRLAKSWDPDVPLDVSPRQVELDNVVPQIEAFQEVQKPSEAFLKESHPVIVTAARGRTENQARP